MNPAQDIVELSLRVRLDHLRNNREVWCTYAIALRLFRAYRKLSDPNGIPRISDYLAVCGVYVPLSGGSIPARGESIGISMHFAFLAKH